MAIGMRYPRRSFSLIMRLLLLVAAILLACFGALWFLGGPTTLEWETRPAVAGPNTRLSVNVRSSYGISQVRAFLDQGRTRCDLYDRSTGISRLTFWRRKESREKMVIPTAAASCPALADGPARLTVQVWSADLRNRSDEISEQVRVARAPASIHTSPEPHYTVHTGPSAAKYHVAGDWVEAGVQVGKYRFRPYAPGRAVVPGQEMDLVSFFTIPWDVDPEEPVQVYVIASDGRRLTANLRMVIERREFRQREIKLTRKFLRQVVDDILGGSDRSDAVVNFKRINSEVRPLNNRKLIELAGKSESKVLWSGSFTQLPKSQVQGQFADTRIYTFEGAKVDQQPHLGVDLASTRNAEVPVANSGKVLLAERLGIYGNCLFVDHGLGVQTLYAHLSRIDVKPGDSVTKGQVIGLTGMTGLAGGDHLHFGMLIDGVETSPVRMFERNWIAKNIRPVVPVPGLEKPANEPEKRRRRR